MSFENETEIKKMYPKVKAREEDQEGTFNLHDDSNSLPVLNMSESPLCVLGSHVENNQNKSPTSVAKISETCAPKSELSFIPASKGPRKNCKQKEVVQVQQDIKPKVRASSVPRPRAVLSSPDNDEMVGNKNKLISRRVSALKKTTLDRYSPPGAQVKLGPLKVGGSLNMKTGSREAFDDKTGRARSK